MKKQQQCVKKGQIKYLSSPLRFPEIQSQIISFVARQVMSVYSDRYNQQRTPINVTNLPFSTIHLKKTISTT